MFFFAACWCGSFYIYIYFFAVTHCQLLPVGVFSVGRLTSTLTWERLIVCVCMRLNEISVCCLKSAAEEWIGRNSAVTCTLLVKNVCGRAWVCLCVCVCASMFCCVGILHLCSLPHQYSLLTSPAPSLPLLPSTPVRPFNRNGALWAVAELIISLNVMCIRRIKRRHFTWPHACNVSRDNDAVSRLFVRV